MKVETVYGMMTRYHCHIVLISKIFPVFSSFESKQTNVGESDTMVSCSVANLENGVIINSWQKNKMIFHFKNSSLKWNSFRVVALEKELVQFILKEHGLSCHSVRHFYVAAIYSNEYDLIKQTHNIRSLQTGSPNKLTLTNCMKMKGWIFRAKKN